MDKIFSGMFSKRPDEIINGDYFYHVPWYESEWLASAATEKSNSNFKSEWDKRTFQNDADWLETIKCVDKPFMDIASSEYMGLASYILKINPETPCLIADIDPNTVKRLRSRINESLPGYNISLASFDNLEIPLKDASINCVTAIEGISASAVGREVNSSLMSLDKFTAVNERNLLDEVYRVLKSDGYFLTIEPEMSWDFDWQKIEDYFSQHENLFGLYTYDVIRSKLEDFMLWKEKYAMCDEKIIAAGFEVESKKIHTEKVGVDVVASYFSATGDMVKIENYDESEDIVRLYFNKILYVLRKK
jgi:Methylase involved in ubiquinone/menaquinone biosynthesis